MYLRIYRIFLTNFSDFQVRVRRWQIDAAELEVSIAELFGLEILAIQVGEQVLDHGSALVVNLRHTHNN